jgi:tight adherence protein C
MTELWIVLGFFASVLCVVIAGGYLLILRRTGDDAGKAPGERADLRNDRWNVSTLARATRLLGEFFPSAARADNPIRHRLVAAGYYQASATTIFYGAKCAAALAAGGALALVAALRQGELAIAMLPALGGAGFGYLLPTRLLEHAIRQRCRRIQRALPTALDLCALSLESGQTLDQALLETSRGLERSCKDLSTELEIVHMEVRASHDRSSALRNLAERTGEPETRKVVTLLLDADRFGTSIVPALRNHSKYLRTRLRQKAHEAARKVSVKLIFPVFFLIFPSVILVTLGPALIMVFTQLHSLLDVK